MKFPFANKEIAEAFAEKNGGSVKEENKLFIVSFESKADKVMESLANCCSEDHSKYEEMLYDAICCIREDFSYSLRYLRDSIEDLWDHNYRMWSDHTDGHLPKAPGPAALKSAVDALGWSGDYEVKPRAIFASKDNGDLEVEYAPKG